jgi:hypothetical protein
MKMENIEIKKMIIENFIDWYISNDDERSRMKDALESYLQEDHVDELSEVRIEDRMTGMFISQLSRL